MKIGEKFNVYRQADHKVLKNKYYSPADLRQLLKNNMKKFITNCCLFQVWLLQQESAQKVVVNREVETKRRQNAFGKSVKEQFLKAPYADWYVKSMMNMQWIKKPSTS
jgi:hypothetical protein